MSEKATAERQTVQYSSFSELPVVHTFEGNPIKPDTQYYIICTNSPKKLMCICTVTSSDIPYGFKVKGGEVLPLMSLVNEENVSIGVVVFESKENAQNELLKLINEKLAPESEDESKESIEFLKYMFNVKD